MTDLACSQDKQVCVLGLGYVGLTLAVAMADVGFKVLGVEIRDEVLTFLNKGEAHFHEPGLQERLRRVIRSGHLQSAKRIPDSWSGSVFIITVGTPLDAQGRSRLDMVQNVAREVADHMNGQSLVIMRSTVKLGTTRKVVLPLLATSGKSFDLAFCPERTLEGKALTELRQLPQIVGGLTSQAAVRASQLFQFITPTVVRVSSLETAEMIKLVDNAQRDVAFAYANEVARACDAIGVSAAEVIQAGKLGYPRTNLPMPGPVGGPCLEKDSHILAEGLSDLGINPEITLAARRTNENQPGEVVAHLRSYTDALIGFSKKPIITLMGLAFKGQPATDDLRGTMARPVFARLRESYPTAEFRGFDAVVGARDIEDFGLVSATSLQRAFKDASLVLILNNHSVFGEMDIEELAKEMQAPGLIYDFWNFFKTADLHLPTSISYMALGSHGQVRSYSI
ncbi:nucleotide sugar dehydrogenase [Haematospirillum sp. 15-248]|uniref:nucleotide sugar dehydrogenase n=1 Tax=Haematospirillum sp. 15-248 TaxID=2723107 RepID=UPI00143B8DD9|nr:nucleotide sugar dehydrogenase [Haematospirillum sp. 15-248]NKD88702.1 nucleotide sugar dehydrogenase [Haematospirillum sp. 15-248]